MAMIMKCMSFLFMSLGVGYILCYLAKKEKGIMKTLGYTLGVSIIVLSLLAGLLCSNASCPMMSKMGKFCGKMARCCPMMQK